MSTHTLLNLFETLCLHAFRPIQKRPLQLAPGYTTLEHACAVWTSLLSGLPVLDILLLPTLSPFGVSAHLPGVSYMFPVPLQPSPSLRLCTPNRGLQRVRYHELLHLSRIIILFLRCPVDVGRIYLTLANSQACERLVETDLVSCSTIIAVLLNQAVGVSILEGENISRPRGAQNVWISLRAAGLSLYSTPLQPFPTYPTTAPSSWASNTLRNDSRYPLEILDKDEDTHTHGPWNWDGSNRW